MQLLPFTTVHAATVAGWPASAEEAVMWCGAKEFPVDERTVAGWAQAEDVTARMLLEGERIVAYGELWFDAEEDEVELARIIVAPWARGTGLGRLLVAGLLKEARAAGHTDVFMRVHPANERALACYRAAGFVPVDRESAALWNVGQPVDYAWLRPGRDPEGDGR